MPKLRKGTLIYALLLLATLSFRVGLACFIPNDDLEQGKVYAQIGRNILEHRAYSHDSDAPYQPTVIRVPGYPLFLAAVYAVFGSDNNTAVRLVQSLVDTATCGLIALIGFYWEPDPKRKRAASIGALVLAFLCPFTAIYVTTILSETVTIFLVVVTLLTTTIAFRAQTPIKLFQWWSISGLLAGATVLFRPDTALFALAVFLTLILSAIFAKREDTPTPPGEASENSGEEPRVSKPFLNPSRALFLAVVFVFAFCLMLAPWTIRNRRVFHVFQPFAPRYADIAGDFVPRGYLKWLRTWLNDERDVELLVWSINTLPIDIEDIPEQAFDSEEEKQRVAQLLERYNRPAQSSRPGSGPPDSGFQLEEVLPQPTPQPSPTIDEEESIEETEDVRDSDDGALSDQTVAMTPAIDVEFAQLANERISRAPFRYYVWLPAKRAFGLWFNSHSQYYPFEGELFPPEGVVHTATQQVLLPLFTALTWIYTFLGIVGTWFLWQSGLFGSRRYVLLAALAIISRFALFAFREEAEARFVVELFPFVSILGGIALVRVVESFITSQQVPRDEAS